MKLFGLTDWKKEAQQWKAVAVILAREKAEYKLLATRAIEKAEELNNSKAFSKQDLKSVTMLCHPDRHNNSRASLRITKILLEMR